MTSQRTKFSKTVGQALVADMREGGQIVNITINHLTGETQPGPDVKLTSLSDLANLYLTNAMLLGNLFAAMASPPPNDDETT